MNTLQGHLQTAVLLAGFVPGLVLCRQATAANCYWNAGGGADKDWSTAANWYTNEPTAADNAFIGHTSHSVNATAEVTQASESCYALYLPDQFTPGAQWGRLEIKPGGRLTVMGGDNNWNWLNVGGGTATGILIQSGGRVDCTNRLQIRGGGEYRLNAGELTTLVYRNGEYEDGGLFVQQSGTTNLVLGGVGMYKTGIHIMSGGVFRTPSMYMANSAIFAQDGGTSDIGLLQMGTTNIQFLLRGGALILTNAQGVNGTFEVEQGATLTCLEKLYVGQSGNGLFLLKGGAIDGSAVLRCPFNQAAGDRATFQGWGNVNLTNEFLMEGRTIADGYGTNRTLAITNCILVGPYYGSNGPSGTNGWFAQNKGRLAMKTGINGGIMRWGAGVRGDEAYWDLVNSVKFDLATPSGGGCIGSLYAPDHSGVPPMARGAGVIGVWRFETNGLSFSSANAAFRYDQSRADELGIETELKVYTHSGSGDEAWVPVATQALNTVSNLIVASNLVDLAWFAIGKDIPRRNTGAVIALQ